MSNWRVRWRRRLGILFTMLLTLKQVQLKSNHVDSSPFSPNLQICPRNTTSQLARDGRPISCDPIDHSTPGNEPVMCVNPEFVCNFVLDCESRENATLTPLDELGCATASCNFEGDSTCGWNNSRKSAHPNTPLWGWIVTQGVNVGNSSTEVTKCKMKDHTLGTESGYYMFADFSAAKPGSTAVFSTPLIGITSSNCELSFYLYIFSNTVGKLEVIQEEPSWNGVRNVTSSRQLYSKNFSSSLRTNQTNTWIRHSITWPKNVFYTIFFEVTVPSLESTVLTGGIAIDDIEFRNCEIPTTTMSPYGSLSAFDTTCPDLTYNCVESAGSVECRTLSTCTCQEYPPDYCGIGGKCVFDNASFILSCHCPPGWSGVPCEENDTDERIETHGSRLKNPLIALFITLGTCVVCTTVGFGVYRVFKRNGSSGSYRDSFENGYDVTFFVTTPPTEETENYASTRGSLSLGTNISNKNLLATTAEWDPE